MVFAHLRYITLPISNGNQVINSATGMIKQSIIGHWLWKFVSPVHFYEDPVENCISM